MSNLGSFVWGNADQLRGVYKPHQYGNVILPMTILRRLDCLIEPSRDRMRQLAAQHDSPTLLATKVKEECGFSCHNTSEYDLARLVADRDGLAANLLDYLARFSRARVRARET